MIVAEKWIAICKFSFGDAYKATALIDSVGRPVKLTSFKEGQRVIVSGFEMPDGMIVAEKIQQQ
jgi:hypothetical protein